AATPKVDPTPETSRDEDSPGPPRSPAPDTDRSQSPTGESPKEKLRRLFPSTPASPSRTGPAEKDEDEPTIDPDVHRAQAPGVLGGETNPLPGAQPRP